MPQTRISEIIKGRRGISADTALRLAKFLGTTPQFWLGLQNDYDLEESQKNISKDLEEIHPVDLVLVESEENLTHLRSPSH